MEPSHGIIISAYLRLQLSSPHDAPRGLAVVAVFILEALYGNDTLIAFPLSEGLTKPIFASSELDTISQNLSMHAQLFSKTMG